MRAMCVIGCQQLVSREKCVERCNLAYKVTTSTTVGKEYEDFKTKWANSRTMIFYLHVTMITENKTWRKRPPKYRVPFMEKLGTSTSQIIG